MVLHLGSLRERIRNEYQEDGSGRTSVSMPVVQRQHGGKAETENEQVCTEHYAEGAVVEEMRIGGLRKMQNTECSYGSHRARIT